MMIAELKLSWGALSRQRNGRRYTDGQQFSAIVNYAKRYVYGRFATFIAMREGRNGLRQRANLLRAIVQADAVPILVTLID